MHNVPELVFLALFCLFAYFVWGRDLDDESGQRSKNNAPAKDSQPPPQALAEQECIHDRNAPVDRLSCDFGQQIKQVLALNASIRQLQSDYEATCQRLHVDHNAQECVIIREQLRIAASYAAEVSRFAFSWVSDKGFYRPSFEDATWAFTAAHLSLSFAAVRVLNLSAP